MKNRLKTLRGNKGWTQADLAMQLDASRQTIIAIEKGKFDPSLPLAFKVAICLDSRSRKYLTIKIQAEVENAHPKGRVA